jgi:hypothetical protein
MEQALARLRAKTDRELSILAEKQLEQTFRLAAMGLHTDAARTYESARRLLQVAQLPAAQRVRLEKQLAIARAVVELPAGAVA